MKPSPPSDASGMFPRNYLVEPATGLKSWFTTLDHKRIGVMFLIAVSIAFALGGFFALLIRLELLTPGPTVMDAMTYNRIFTLHGVVMIFLFMIPAIPSGFGNFFLPIMLGAKDVAFPRLNLLSWYIYLAGAAIAVYGMINGGTDTGWTFYTPYSTTTATKVVPVLLGAFVIGFSSILTGLNFIVTIHKMRAPGMTWFRMPLFVWAHYATAIIQILGTPVVAITILLVALERIFHFGFFDPNRGGDPILFQHLFWFYSHPAVYIMILPSMGVISEIVTCFSRKRIFGYSFIAMSSLAIAAIGFLVWAHHMYVTGMAVYSAMVFSALTYLVAVPSAIKTFNWTATLFRGSVQWDTPMIYVFCFIGLFLIGGLTGLFLGNLGVDVHLTDTYFVVAHFHYTIIGSTIYGLFAATYFWFPKITGRMYSERLGKLHFWWFTLAFNLTFLPMFWLGIEDMRRRVSDYPPELGTVNLFVSIMALNIALSVAVFVFNMVRSWARGPRAEANPWRAQTLEWTVSSPPPIDNFHDIPVVSAPPYEYGNGKPAPGGAPAPARPRPRP